MWRPRSTTCGPRRSTAWRPRTSAMRRPSLPSPTTATLSAAEIKPCHHTHARVVESGAEELTADHELAGDRELALPAL